MDKLKGLLTDANKDKAKALMAEANMSNVKVLMAEAGENVMVAGSWLFLIIAFLAAMAEPKAALLPLVIGVGCYLLARKNDTVN